MKRNERILLLLCAALLAFVLSSCGQRRAAQVSPDAPIMEEAVDETSAPAPADDLSGEDDGNAAEPEEAASDAVEDTLLPELEIPDEPLEPADGDEQSRPDEQSQHAAETQESRDSAPEQESETGIVTEESGDILLPELP